MRWKHPERNVFTAEWRIVPTRQSAVGEQVKLRDVSLGATKAAVLLISFDLDNAVVQVLSVYIFWLITVRCTTTISDTYSQPIRWWLNEIFGVKKQSTRLIYCWFQKKSRFLAERSWRTIRNLVLKEDYTWYIINIRLLRTTNRRTPSDVWIWSRI